MNLTKFSPPCSHFGITIFEQEEEKRGIPLYQTWHIVDFTNAQAFFVSACEQATSGKIKLVN